MMDDLDIASAKVSRVRTGRVHQGQPFLNFPWVLLGAIAAGCGGSASSGGTSSAGGAPAAGASGASCPTGSETCACYGNRTCNDGLACASNLCVAVGTGGTVATAGSATVGMSGTTPGQPSFGGLAGSGGNISTGGLVHSNGETAGSGQFAGTASTGGTTGGNLATGGNATGGNATGGNATGGMAFTNAGGSDAGQPSSAVGGATAGGSRSTSAGTSNAGQASIGGTDAQCGDGVLQVGETCDPASKVSNIAVACGSDCTLTPGWACDVASCHAVTCGDGKVEGAEGCDPSVKNNDLGDGCSPNCTVEPVCPAAGGGCVSRCGDGLTLGAEQCDDGNAVSGDGCSSTCQIETGYLCVPAPIGSTLIVPMVVRDFNAGGDFEKGGAFARDLNLPNQGLLKNLLDSNGLKPVLASATGTYNGMSGTDSGIASPASFAQWYSDTATGPNAYNKTLSTTLNLYQVEGSNPTTYANRFGNNGDGLTSAQYRRVTQELCSLVGREDHDASGNALPCTSCFDNSIVPCSVPVATACQTNPGFIECVKSAGGSNWMGVFLQATFDGNPLWFPADRLMPASPAAVAQVAGNYDESWPEDPTGKLHNFAFTTEIRFWFRYDSLRQYRLGVSNDDDLWVFVNKRLAVDIGGIHTPVEGELTFGNGATSVRVSNTLPSGYNNRISSTPDLGLLDGNVYEVAVFQAQRQTKASSFKLSLSGFDTTRSACRPN